VQVSGTSLVNIFPDQALIQLGVQSNGYLPAEVGRSNSIAINKIVRALKGAGIEEKEISYDLYYMELVYSN
jgi:hypothetical protein